MNDNMYIPQVGNSFYIDGINWIVVGTGSKHFEHHAERGIFAVVDLDKMDCMLIIIRDKKVSITIDPSIPSVKANNEELLKVYGSKGTYALLEFDRKNN